MKKNPGRSERRKLAKQSRISENRKLRALADSKAKKNQRLGISVEEGPKKSRPTRLRKQNPKWFNRRKKVTMTRVWAKDKNKQKVG